MSLQITGKVIEILPEQSGQGRNGDWRKGTTSTSSP
jgi:hypothetical protein